jgi:hypothetical protein
MDLTNMEIVFEEPPPKKDTGPRAVWPERFDELVKPEYVSRWTRWESGSMKAAKNEARRRGVDIEIRSTTTVTAEGKKRQVLWLKILPGPEPPHLVWNKEEDGWECSECDDGFVWDIRRKAENHLRTMHGSSSA